jgi:uncharacterized protein with von Willebrand factor type A (vWA) domain
MNGPAKGYRHREQRMAGDGTGAARASQTTARAEESENLVGKLLSSGNKSMSVEEADRLKQEFDAGQEANRNVSLPFRRHASKRA